MTTSESPQQPAPLTTGIAQGHARPKPPRRSATMFVACLSVMLGASLGLGILLGRISIWSRSASPPPISLAEQARIGEPKNGSQTNTHNKDRERALAKALEPTNTQPSQEPSSHGAAKLSGAVSNEVAPDVGAVQKRANPQITGSPPVEVVNRSTINAEPAADDPSGKQQWLKRAEEARRQAGAMARSSGKRELLNIAEAYERLAQHAMDTDESADKTRRRYRSRHGRQ